jgi:predicted HTH transcriptional regulator
MDTKELEEILEGQTETQSIDFKSACNWNVGTFVKDILAMTNVQDGGHIIVGVEDGTFERRGMTQEQVSTYNHDSMKDQLAEYADPHVEIRVFTPKDVRQRQYVVIRVAPFEEVPVICKKDGADVARGSIYYRGKSRRPESARVCSSYDMRDIIKLATVRMMQRKRALGFTVVSSEKEKLDAELGGL